ncbi:sushi domain-containing protein 3 [Platysternon megacephalum]|uniref:Sushi domain-containing protein 3 n=1 Tax=Platysternon megacephalum TaxID=55544 RepID=A0A4D9EZ17_9SAUR|nr:sushi domain-containing protein 3 [Platysternon megacephalum]
MSCGGASSIPGTGEPQRDPAAAAAAPLELPGAEESAGLRRLQPQEKPAADDPPGAGQSSGSGGTPPGPSEGRRGGSERARGEAGAVGGDKPETRSVCGSDSGSDSNPGGAGPICKICFQGAEQGELLNPCRCDGSWQSITITLVEKVQMIAVILGSLFLVASVTWLLWSAFSPYAVWQRKDILFQICYGMYGFMDLVCIGLIVHEGASVYRVFKRWRAVNLHWDVLNYDKATDIEESNRGASSPGRTLWLPLTAFRNRNLIHPTQLTSPRFQCGYVLLHLFNRMRPHEDSSEDNSSGEVVMRVTSV